MSNASSPGFTMPTLVLAASLWFCATVSAQFGDFTWSFAGDPSGSMEVDDEQMHIVGPAWGACTTPDTFAHATATASQSGTVSAHFFFDNQDGGFGWWTVEDPVYVVDGAMHVVGPGDIFSTWEGDVSFHVDAGESFGFGVLSADCDFGPGVLDVTGFTFTPDVWQDLGHGLAGTFGVPSLVGIGTLQAETPYILSLIEAKETAPAWLVLGLSPLVAPFKGGTLVPDPTPPGQVVLLMTGVAGRIVLSGTWPAGIPAGLTLHLQYWIADPAGPQGFSASNAVAGTTP